MKKNSNNNKKNKNSNIKENFKKNLGDSAVGITKLLANKKFIYVLLGILLLSLGFVAQYFLNRPNFGTFLGSDMDLSNNVYILGVNEENNEYKITKVSQSGATKFQLKLEKSNDKYENVYKNLEVDSKGNIYIVKQQKKIDAVVSDASMYPTTNEKILMYDHNGIYIKEIASIDFTQSASPPVEPYIQKIQIVDQNMFIIAREGNYYDIISANPLLDEAPKKIKSFEIVPDGALTNQNYQWVSDMSVLSSGRIFYSTLNGKLYGTNNQGVFEDYSSVMKTNNFLISDMSIDPNDDLYFTDTVTGRFYKLNTKSISLQTLYNLDSPLYENTNLIFRDIKKVKCLDTGDFYGNSKSYEKVFHVRFGSNNYLVGNLRGSFFPWGLIIMILVILLVIGIFYGIKFLAKLEIKRIPLVVRILSLFLPVFIISMIVLVGVNTLDGVKEYMSLLKSEQERGAKTASDLISGSDFAKLNHVSGYMNSDYIKLKNSLQKSHSDIYSKIGDRSDYLVTYVENYGSLYTSINTKYDVNSESYNRLKYTNPDMVPNGYCLIDYVLEQDEVEKLYNIWNKFVSSDNTEYYMDVEFKDVYGDLTASFAPIKDSNGQVVGLVGNFLDEKIHQTREFWEILKHASALILIITILIIFYVCFIIKYALRPLKKIEKSIKTTETGTWDTRIKLKSKDEFADIAEAFNIMSEKIQRYTSNLIKLNKEYIRYIPDKLFKLIDKDKITQVNLHDNKSCLLNIVQVNFNISCNDKFDFNNQIDVFRAISESYEKLFDVVEQNHGIVHSFDGLGLIALFPDSPDDAFLASLQFKELEINKFVKDQMHILLGSGYVLTGISGDSERRGVILISDELMQLYNMNSRLSILDINHVATESIIKNIENIKNKGTLSFRYIGRAENTTGGEFTNIYQIIENNNKYKKDLYISTFEIFEKAVKLYLNSEFEEARKLFASVIRTNENDKVSMRYLLLCDEELNKINQIGMTKNFTGYII